MDAGLELRIGRTGEDLANVFSADRSEDVDRAVADVGGVEYPFAEGNRIPVIRYNSDSHQRSITLLRWGLRRSELDAGQALVVVEDVVRDSYLVQALERRRCLVPAQAVRARTPAGEQTIGAGSLMALAGVWTSFRKEEGKIERSFALLAVPSSTADGGEAVTPCVVAFEDHAAWLGQARAAQSDILAMMQPAAWRAA